MLAILEALETVQEQAHRQNLGLEHNRVSKLRRSPQVSGREVASRLQLHPNTVYAYLKRLRTLGIIEKRSADEKDMASIACLDSYLVIDAVERPAARYAVKEDLT